MTTSKRNIFALGVVALVVVIGAFFGLPSLFTSQSAAGYSQSDVGKFEEGAQLGTTGSRYYSGVIKAGNDQVSYRNTSGKDQYVDLAILRTTGTASTTQTLTAGTSTSATFNGFSVPSNIKSLVNAIVATSSVATTTDSVNGYGAAEGTVRLADGDYLNIGVYQTFGNQCTGAVCETATSTNRGYDVRYVIRVLQPESY